MLGKRCYVLEDEDIDIDVNNIPNFELFFGDNNSNGKPEKLKVTTDSYDEWNDADNGFKVYDATKLYAFEMNSNYFEKLSGRLTTNPRVQKHLQVLLYLLINRVVQYHINLKLGLKKFQFLINVNMRLVKKL